MVIDPILNYKVLYDNQKPMCFIGSSYINKHLYDYFSPTRECYLYRYEEVLEQSQEWFDQHQFIIAVASIQFKKLVVDNLQKFNPNYFTVYSEDNHVHFRVSIGRGVYICYGNSILDDAVIGDHVMITTHTSISHDCKIGSFAHIGPYTQLMFTNIGNGCYVASRSSFIGSKAEPLEVADYSNFIIGSTVTKPITESGTFFGNRRIDTATSLDKKID